MAVEFGNDLRPREVQKEVIDPKYNMVLDGKLVGAANYDDKTGEYVFSAMDGSTIRRKGQKIPPTKDPSVGWRKLINIYSGK